MSVLGKSKHKQEINKQNEHLWVNNAFSSSWQPRDILRLPVLFEDGGDNVITQPHSHRPSTVIRIKKLSQFHCGFFFCLTSPSMSVSKTQLVLMEWQMWWLIVCMTENLLWGQQNKITYMKHFSHERTNHNSASKFNTEFSFFFSCHTTKLLDFLSFSKWTFDSFRPYYGEKTKVAIEKKNILFWVSETLSSISCYNISFSAPKTQVWTSYKKGIFSQACFITPCKGCTGSI